MQTYEVHENLKGPIKRESAYEYYIFFELNSHKDPKLIDFHKTKIFRRHRQNKMSNNMPYWKSKDETTFPTKLSFGDVCESSGNKMFVLTYKRRLNK